MLKKEIEKVLLYSFDYFQSGYASCLDIGALCELSEYVIERMSEEYEIKNSKKYYYIVSRAQLSRLRSSGEYKFQDVWGNTILLKYADDHGIPSILESGTTLIWDEQGYADEEKNEFGTTSPHQSVLPVQPPKRKKRAPQYPRIGFDKDIDNVDDLMDMCKKFKWKRKAYMLERIRSDVRDERLNRSIMNGKQKTMRDYDN